MKKEDIRTYSLQEIKEFLNHIGQKPFVVNQILDWLYNKNVSDFDDMTNLSKNLREILNDNFTINKSNIIKYSNSDDGSVKLLLDFNNNDAKRKDSLQFHTIAECVAIPSVNKNSGGLTACVSSQIGCGINCKFCATGKQGFTRNLTYAEIIEQVQKIEEITNKRVSNIVFMGQGEPFMNYQSLLDALEVFNNSNLFNIGARKITVSTCGIVPKIYDFSNVSQQYRLALSLHSAVQSTRDIIMPGVRKYNLSSLKKALIYYQQKTNRRITIEYLMLKNINDDYNHLASLLDYCKKLNCYINLIPYNSTDNSFFEPSSPNVIKDWENGIQSNNIKCYVRKSKGKDINGACGQLKSAYNSSN